MFNCKKLLSLALAATMAAALAVPAFADETKESTTNRSLTVSGTYKAVDIAVVVPSTGTVVVNPYALPVTIVDKTDDAAAIVVKGRQIVTKPMAIKNQSDTKLDINVSYTAKVQGALTFATAPIDDVTKDTKNDAFVCIDIVETTVTEDSAIDAAYGEQTWHTYDKTTSTTEDKNPNMLVVKATTTAVSKAGMGTLAAASLDDDGAFSAYNSGSIAFVGLTGQCAQAPKTAWTAKDGMSVTIAFTFTPNTTADNTEVEEPED
jgi:hypothetical protein